MTGRGGKGQKRNNNDQLAATASLSDVISMVNSLSLRVEEQEKATTGILDTLSNINTSFGNIQTATYNTSNAMTMLKRQVNNNTDQVKGLTSTLDATGEVMKKMSETAEVQTRVLTHHEQRFEKQEKEEKKRIMIIDGLTEHDPDNLELVQSNLLKDI